MLAKNGEMMTQGRVVRGTKPHTAQSIKARKRLIVRMSRKTNMNQSRMTTIGMKRRAKMVVEMDIL